MNTDNQNKAGVAGICETCGSSGAENIGGRSLCTACYTACGSCCAEFQEVDEDAEVIKRIAREVAAGI